MLAITTAKTYGTASTTTTTKSPYSHNGNLWKNCAKTRPIKWYTFFFGCFRFNIDITLKLSKFSTREKKTHLKKNLNLRMKFELNEYGHRASSFCCCVCISWVVRGKEKKTLPITGYENAVLCIGLPMKPS